VNPQTALKARRILELRKIFRRRDGTYVVDGDTGVRYVRPLHDEEFSCSCPGSPNCKHAIAASWYRKNISEYHMTIDTSSLIAHAS